MIKIDLERLRAHTEFVKSFRNNPPVCFNMDTYGRVNEGEFEYVIQYPSQFKRLAHACGTAACFGGYAPLNPDPIFEPQETETWKTYLDRIFFRGEQLASNGNLFEDASDWNFIFSPNWPNDLDQAIARAEHLLANPDYVENLNILHYSERYPT